MRVAFNRWLGLDFTALETGVRHPEGVAIVTVTAGIAQW